VSNLAEELLVRYFKQVFEWRNVSRTEAAADAAAEEWVDSVPVSRRNKSRPSNGGVQ